MLGAVVVVDGLGDGFGSENSFVENNGGTVVAGRCFAAVLAVGAGLSGGGAEVPQADASADVPRKTAWNLEQNICSRHTMGDVHVETECDLIRTVIVND